MLEFIVPALQNLLTIENLIWINLGVFIGSVFAAIPGLTVILCIILFLPFTYQMTAIPGMMFLLGIYCAGGYGGRQFGPDDSITWEQLAVMLWRYAGSPDATADMSSYTDAADVSEWARQAMAWCVEQGIIGGESTSTPLAPQGKVTRAQIAVILQKFCQLG